MGNIVKLTIFITRVFVILYFRLSAARLKHSFYNKLIKWSWLNPYPCHDVASLDKKLRNDYLDVEVSNKKQI